MTQQTPVEPLPASDLFGAWVPVEESLPFVCARVLAFGVDVYCDERDIHEAMLCSDGAWRTRAEYAAAPGEKVELQNVSHWMPLPPPPND